MVIFTIIYYRIYTIYRVVYNIPDPGSRTAFWKTIRVNTYICEYLCRGGTGTGSTDPRVGAGHAGLGGTKCKVLL